jgi:quinol monooxygenase YgiN
MRPLLHLILAMAMLPMATASARAEAAADETVYIVSYIDAAPASAARNQTAALLRQLAETSRRDQGNLRFEVLQRTVPANQFMILETWKDQAALDAHNNTGHTKTFRERVMPHLISPIDDRNLRPFAVAPVPTARVPNALYVVTHVDVPPASREKIEGPLQALAEASRKETGVLRFDVVQQKNRINHFKVIETWRDQRSNDAHEVAAHTKEFRNVLGPMTGALYDQRWYKAL